MAIDIAKFRNVDDFKSMMDDMISEMHATPSISSEERVLVAGDPEADIQEDRLKNGVTVENNQYDELRDRASNLGVEIFI